MRTERKEGGVEWTLHPVSCGREEQENQEGSVGGKVWLMVVSNADGLIMDTSEMMSGNITEDGKEGFHRLKGASVSPPRICRHVI